MDFPSCEWQALYSYVCNDRKPFNITMDAIINAITHLKPENSDGFDD